LGCSHWWWWWSCSFIKKQMSTINVIRHYCTIMQNVFSLELSQMQRSYKPFT
jgi:hypothetical protein